MAGRKVTPDKGTSRLPGGVSPVVFATYRVREGRETEFQALLARHWPTLRKLNLVTAEKPVFYERRDEEGKPLLVEIFSWQSPEAVGEAHESPAVMAIWSAMEELLEDRQGRPRFEFPHFAPLAVKLVRV